MSTATGTNATLPPPLAAQAAYRHELCFTSMLSSNASWSVLNNIVRDLLRGSDETYIEHLRDDYIEFYSIETPEAATLILRSNGLHMVLESNNPVHDQLHRQIILQIIHFQMMVSCDAYKPALQTSDPDLGSAAWEHAAGCVLGYEDGEGLTVGPQQPLSKKWRKLKRKLKVSRIKVTRP